MDSPIGVDFENEGKKPWRPENWDEIVKDAFKKHNMETALFSHRYVADFIASAMLEALKKDGTYLHNTGTMPYGFVLGRSLKLGEKGWLVFIPEEEKNGKTQRQRMPCE